MRQIKAASRRQAVENVVARRRARLLDRILDLLRGHASAAPYGGYCYLRAVHAHGSAAGVTYDHIEIFTAYP